MSQYFKNFNAQLGIVQFVELKLDIVDISVLYSPIIFKDGDNFVKLSNELYDNTNFGWIIWRVNHLNGEWDIPLTNNFIHENIENPDDILYFENNDGRRVYKNGIILIGTTEFSFNDLESSLPPGVIAISNLENRLLLNDEKRNMRVINKKYINQFDKTFQDVLTGRARIGII